ncbi:MAG: DUF1553 domain-containing protein, partial [Planctomycetales bacterium]|nr:DUF1553 domain-containing protein [Planctomycetales bacterium]
FNRDIRPILSEYCFACHGPDQNHREADLRLDDREAAIDYGAISPNDPDASLLVERILDDDPDVVMPPPKGGKKLSADDKEKLIQWIRQGATYQKHWSFEPLPATVSVPDAGSGWARRDIDRFVAKEMTEKQLKPTDEVDRATWLRRVSFDLTGLPPSLDQLDDFLADRSDEAYEKVVDRLLSSDAYGERMANMWLDVARYADTFGYQNDVAMEVWPWRDWVINAFNRNMPYDQFIIEQLAGDLLPNASMNEKLATTFNRLHRQTNEGGSVSEEFRLTGIADRTTTAGTAFLGLTMECCRCHDHKFDPIMRKEFYQLSAYFSDIDELGLYSHFTFSAPTPAMPLYTGDQEWKHRQALDLVAAAGQKYDAVIAAASKRFSAEPGQWITELPVPPEAAFHSELESDVDGIVGRATRFNGDDSIDLPDAPKFGRADAFTYSIWIKPAKHASRMVVLHQSRAAEDSGFRGLQLTVEEGHPQFSMIHFWPGDAVRIQSTQTIPIDQWTHLAVAHDGSGRADGLRVYLNGNLASVDVIRDNLTRDIRHRKEWGDMDVDKVGLSLGARFRDIGFRDGSLDDLKVFDRQLSDAEVLSIYEAVRPSQDAPKIDADLAIQHHLLVGDAEVANARTALFEARKAENELNATLRYVMVMHHFDQAPQTHVLGRGEYTNKEDAVSPGTPSLGGVLPATGGDRLDLAKWMVDPKNPLPARVMSNRMWHLFFGRGIVVTLEDFGSQGTPPSHPELLDYLAKSLIDHDWDLHWLCREIVLSATYRQSSRANDSTSYTRDPDNVWLARGPKHRLSAEQLRDTVLAASGLLVDEVGGPSVMPYQPAGLWEEAGTGKSYHQSKGDGLYRRSMYTFWKRTSPPPTMLTFDATSRESCTPRRELTTTPLQALVILNDPQHVEAARVLAEQLIKTHGDALDGRWDELFRRALSRLPSDRERQIFHQTYQEQQAFFSNDPDAARELLAVGEKATDESLPAVDLAATTVTVQTLFAYDETIMLR